MKNASCNKLLIDRSKAQKVGTLKDISLFGNFCFPTAGEFADGLQLRPLAGVGSTVGKTKAQIAQLAGRQTPIAGATGAKTLEEQPAMEPAGCPAAFSGPRNEGYAVRFLQHAPEQPTVSTLQHLEVDQFELLRLESGFALKHGPGKRTMFSQAQKDIMIEFYNRQAVNRIRAEPKDVMKAMKDAGLEVLTVTQIKSWWSTYHRKNKNANVQPPATTCTSTASRNVPPPAALGSILSAATPLSLLPVASARTVPPAASPSSLPTGLPSNVQSAAAPTIMPSAAPTIMPSAAASTNEPLAADFTNVQPDAAPTNVPPAVASTMPPNSTAATVLSGSISKFSNVVFEWSFQEDFSQSTIRGRNGSNACTFISLYFGRIASKGLLPPHQGLQLSIQWKDAPEEAILRGNDLHNDMFDHAGINVNVDDAVDMAGEDCGILCTGQQKDLFGQFSRSLLAELLDELANRRQHSCHLFFSSGRTMFLMCDSCGSLCFVDSHSHKNSGALIACAPPGSGVAFAEWIDKMMDFHWSCPLTVGSVNEIIYT